MNGRPTAWFGTRAWAASALCAVAALCGAGCADIWGFDDLRGTPDGGGSRDLGTLPVGTDDSGTGPAGSGGDRGGVGGTGAGGSVSPVGTGGVTGVGGIEGVGGSSGSGGVPGSGGGAGAVAGVGGRIGTGGRTGTGGSGAGGAGTGGAGTGGAGTGGMIAGTGGAGVGGRAGTGGAGGSVCTAGTNRCVGGDLQTCSTTGVWQSTGTSTHQLLVNPGFEDGDTGSGWTTFVAGGFALIYIATGNGGDGTPGIAAQSPNRLAWFGGYSNADDSATQSVAIPADATSINVSFYYAVFTRKTGTAETDVMDVTVTSGAQTTRLAHFSNANPVATWTRFSATLPTTLAGQTVRLEFRDLTNGSNALSSFYIDTVAVQVVACP